mgnify:CR=1 FL=1
MIAVLAFPLGALGWSLAEYLIHRVAGRACGLEGHAVGLPTDGCVGLDPPATGLGKFSHTFDVFFRVNESLQYFFDLSAQLETVFE